MKQLITRSALVLLGSVAVAAGCSSTPAAPAGGTGGSSGDASAGGVPLIPDPTGFVALSTTGTTNIVGAWYSYGDGVDSNGTTAAADCEFKGMHQPSECSIITAPTFGGFPNTLGNMCTTGTVAKVINLVGGASPDYSNIWGAGIALDLNNGGGDAGVKAPYDAIANGVTGFSFKIDTVPLAGLRVEFPTKTNMDCVDTTPNLCNGSPIWSGATMANSNVKAGLNTIKWSAVGGPTYDTAPKPFDPKTLYSLQFHVPTGTATSSDYSFCISELTALTN
jgi:hypothetical protein